MQNTRRTLCPLPRCRIPAAAQACGFASTSPGWHHQPQTRGTRTHVLRSSRWTSWVPRQSSGETTLRHERRCEPDRARAPMAQATVCSSHGPPRERAQRPPHPLGAQKRRAGPLRWEARPRPPAHQPGAARARPWVPRRCRGETVVARLPPPSGSPARTVFVRSFVRDRVLRPRADLCAPGARARTAAVWAWVRWRCACARPCSGSAPGHCTVAAAPIPKQRAAQDEARRGERSVSARPSTACEDGRGEAGGALATGGGRGVAAQPLS